VAELPAPTPAAELQPLWDELTADGPHVGIVLAGEPERELLEPAATELSERAISFEIRVIPPHLDPRGVAEYASTAALRGVRVIIATCAGGAGLAGQVASYTELPVVGVPLASPELGGLDSLLAAVQMPPGVPVGCMAIGGARNAAIYAAKILSQGPTGDPPSD
jgi:phosphoribosylaminoimidazole carboxylase PurE protein